MNTRKLILKVSINRINSSNIQFFNFLKFLLGSKEQVIANLANFSYDPINFDYLRRLKVIDLFLNALSDSNKKIVKFAIGGICNLCLGKTRF